MKRILLTGSNGQLGREVIRQTADREDIKLVAVDIDELDITNFQDVTFMTKEIKPDCIINCAAYTAVDQAETDEDRAFSINAIGPKNLAIASFELGIPIVHISTDYVFNGLGICGQNGKLRPYREYDRVGPQTAYGRTKLEGEIAVARHNLRHYILRTAWLYGEGSNFVRTMLRLGASQDTVRVVEDQIGSPTSTRELTQILLKLLLTGQYGLYHATCEGSCSWYEFTKEIYRLAGIGTQVVPVTSAEYPRPAIRPKYSVLESYMLHATTPLRFAHWQQALVEYLK